MPLRRLYPAVCAARLVTLTLGLSFACFPVACGDDRVAPRRPLTTQTEGPERLPDQVIQSGTHIVTREGVKKAVLVARQISFFNLDARVEADTMEITFFDSNGLSQSRMTARFGEIDQRTNDMVARGQVLILAEDGTRIEGEELRYVAARDRIVSDKPVTILQGGNRFQGQGVEADPALTTIRLTGSSAVLRRAPGTRRPAGAAPPPAPPAAGAGAVGPGGAVAPPPPAPLAPPGGESPGQPAPTSPTGPPAAAPAPPAAAPAPPPAAQPPASGGVAPGQGASAVPARAGTGGSGG